MKDVESIILLYQYVLDYLDVCDIGVLACVSRQFLKFCDEDIVWKPRVLPEVYSLTEINSLVITTALDHFLPARCVRNKIEGFGNLYPSIYKYIYQALRHLNGAFQVYSHINAEELISSKHIIQNKDSPKAIEILTKIRKRLLSKYSVLALAGSERCLFLFQSRLPSIHFVLQYIDFDEVYVVLNITLKSVSKQILFLTRFALIRSNRGGDELENQQQFEFRCAQLDDKSIQLFFQKLEPLLKELLTKAPTATPYIYRKDYNKYTPQKYMPCFPISWQPLIMSLDASNLDDELKLQVSHTTKAVLQGKSWENMESNIRKAIRRHLDSLGTSHVKRPSPIIEVAILRCVRRTINKLLAPILDLYRNQNPKVAEALKRVGGTEKMLAEKVRDSFLDKDSRIWSTDDAIEAVPEAFHMALCTRGRNGWPLSFPYKYTPFPPNSLVVLRVRATCDNIQQNKKDDVLDGPWVRWPLGAQKLVSFFLPHIAKWVGLQALIAARNSGTILPALQSYESTIDEIVKTKLTSCELEIQNILKVLSPVL